MNVADQIKYPDDQPIIRSERFWPPRDKYVVETVSLPDAQAVGLSASLAQLLNEMTSLSDAIRAVEGSTGGQEATLRKKLAVLLRKAANEVSCLDTTRALKLRADVVLSGNKEAQLQLATLDEKELVAICGPLGTWLGKSRGTFHSCLFAKPDHSLNETISNLDRAVPAIQLHLQEVIGEPLQLDSPPRIVYSQLLCCGGEAGTYPKHFAYFLPEDEGVKRAKTKKTVVFTNTYTENYTRISRPFTKDIIVSGADSVDSAVTHPLAFWFRAHDICHGVRLAETDYKVMRCEGYWNSMVLQEAIADVFGFLISNSGPWSDMVGMDLALNSTIYLREAFRYLCRGGDAFPDAGAALVQLSFLSCNGYIHLDRKNTQVNFEPDAVFEGMVALAKLLTNTALSNSSEGIAAFLGKYYEAGIHDFVSKCGICNSVLEYR